MSRIGKQPVLVPAGVDVTIDGQNVSVKGPKGALALAVAEPISVARNDDGAIVVARPDDERRNRSLHGLSRTLVANLITGVTEGYTTKMEIFGVGYRVQLKGNTLEFALGYSHPVIIEAPEGITLRGRDAHQVLDHRNRQAEGRPDLGEHPSPAPPRPVQGQGRPLRGRADPPQGRKDR